MSLVVRAALATLVALPACGASVNRLEAQAGADFLDATSCPIDRAAIRRRPDLSPADLSPRLTADETNRALAGARVPLSEQGVFEIEGCGRHSLVACWVTTENPSWVSCGALVPADARGPLPAPVLP